MFAKIIEKNVEKDKAEKRLSFTSGWFTRSPTLRVEP